MPKEAASVVVANQAAAQAVFEKKRGDVLQKRGEELLRLNEEEKRRSDELQRRGEELLQQNAQLQQQLAQLQNQVDPLKRKRSEKRLAWVNRRIRAASSRKDTLTVN